jgi:SAM-dependent methyltransferase
MKRYFDANREMWDDLVEVNARSAMYDLEGFRAGRTSLRHIELEELGPVAGRDLLHIQCHFGMDTLSWAREGARVTGSDLSERAVERARALATELAIDARFVCSNSYDLPEQPELAGERFDVVFLSYGALIWLPDMARLAAVIAHFLRPGGIFYMAEFHPLFGTFSDDGQEAFARSYFHDPDPLRYEESGSYAEPDNPTVWTSYEWQHPVGEVVSALCAAGLRLEFLHEFDASPWTVPGLEEVAPERAVVARWPGRVPLIYSIKATLPG